MPPSVGDKLGPYEIIAPIGKGGMGEVYRARDPRLKRDVAIKVSAAQFSERFEREAQAIAALNHSNICQLYDVGPNYLVMEYIEGTPLKGPQSVDQALKYAVQICDALDAAHKKGITHRDLKPANILVTKAGIKLLDFGLAKLASANSGQAAKPPDDATLTMALTGKNEIVGTLYYMSPEQLQSQANGQEIDGRSDIFSFGIVLYEMLTGKRAFEGSSPASVIAAIMERPAPSIATIAPAALDRLLQRCLAKDPDDRWQSARDLKAELAWIAGAPGEATASSTPSSSGLGKLPWIVAAGLAIGLIGVSWVAWRATRPIEQPLKPLVRLDVDLGTDASFTPQAGAETILSPDGTRLVFVSQGKLFTRRLDQPKTSELAGTEGTASPFFSPDGRLVGFYGQGKLKAILVEGGAAVILCDSPQIRGASWGEDGNIIASLFTYGALSRIPASGGSPSPLTELAAGEATHRWPQILPGGRAVLFTAHTSGAGFDAANIDVMTLADHRRKTLQRGGTFGRYLGGPNGTGHLVYINKGTMFAVPFDPEKLEVRGTPSPVLEEIAYASIDGSAQFDFSRDGTLVYRTGGAGGSLVTMQWLDAAGKVQPLLAKPGVYGRPRISPDGERVAFDDSSDIWVYEARRETTTRLTFDGARNITPVWTPDGRYILFSGVGGIWFVRSDAASKPQLLIESKNPLYPFSFTHDGKRLAYNEVKPTTAYDILTTSIESDGTGLRVGKPEIFLQTSADERTPTLSPDGRWMVYTSNESGRYEVYVRAFPDKGGKWQISNAGGAYPVWSPNGQELYFRTEDNRIMVAKYVAKANSFVPDKPRLWYDKRLADFGAIGVSNFDVAPDGNRVVAMMPVEGPEAQRARNHVIFLMNFFDELQRKVPTGK